MRHRRLATVVALALPLAAISTAGAQITTSALIQEVQVHKGALLRYIDAAPDSMLGFRPTKGVRTFAEQIEHAAQADAFIATLAITGSGRVSLPGDSAKYLHDKAALKAFATAAMDHTVELLRGVSEAQMAQEITMFGQKLPRWRGLMALLDHFPWTLGQTVAYLRLNGVTPPAYTPF